MSRLRATPAAPRPFLRPYRVRSSGVALKQLALNKGLRVGDTKRPEEPSYDMLTKLSSPGLRQGVLGGDGQGSERDVAEFRRMSEQGQDPDLKAWAARTLPTLEGQLQTVKAVQGTMGASR